MSPSSRFAPLQRQIAAGIALAQAGNVSVPISNARKEPTKRKRVPTQKGAVYAQEIATEKENIGAKKKRARKNPHRVDSENEAADLGDKGPEISNTEPMALDFPEIRRNGAYESIPVHPQSQPASLPSMMTPISGSMNQTLDTRQFASQVDTNIQSPSPVSTLSIPDATPTLHSPMIEQVPIIQHVQVSNTPRLTTGTNPTHVRNVSGTQPHAPSPTSTRTRSNSPDPQPTSSSKCAPKARNRPKLQDLAAGPKTAVLMAIQDYRSRLATDNPFPNPSEESTMAGSTLLRACVSCMVDISNDLLENAVALIIARDSQMRGELKCKLIPLVQSMYGFRSQGTQSAIGHNRRLHDLLKSENRLAFKFFKTRKGLYENPLIQQAINTMWFRDARDEGVKYAEYFNPMPIKTIALILTTVEHIIDRWATGTFKGQVPFTEKEYVNVYEHHLSALEDLQNYSEAAAKKLKRIQQRLYSRARRHAGLKKDEDVVPLLDEEDLEAFAGATDSDSDTSPDPSEDEFEEPLEEEVPEESIAAEVE